MHVGTGMIVEIIRTADNEAESVPDQLVHDDAEAYEIDDLSL
jgi:hypothetical protein